MILEDLNDEQNELLSEISKWFITLYKQTFEVSGPAGSGKTSIVEMAINKLGLSSANVLYMAYVGKAAMALTLRGNNAKTIHSTLYNMVMKPLYDEKGNEVIRNNRQVKYRGFKKRAFLSSEVKLLVIDEGSMVNEVFKADILSFGLPVLVLGDLNQLPPVIGNPAFLINPDFILTQVMRQAKDDPIIKLSQMAIRGEEISIDKYGDRCYVIPKEMLDDEYLKLADIILCGRNTTRQNMTDYYRRNILGIKGAGTPIIGEKIICRQNNWNLSIDGGICLINGLIGYIDKLDLESYNKSSIGINFRPEFETSEIFEDILMDYKYLFTPMEDAANSRQSRFNKFQFAYVITAHLAQGSQYDNVLVYDEKMGDQDYYNKWLYTCITRAVKGLVIAKSPIVRRQIKKKDVFKDAA